MAKKLSFSEQTIVEWIRKEPGINIYQLGKRLGVGYATVFSYVKILEVKGIITTKLVPMKIVRRIYLKDEQNKKE